MKHMRKLLAAVLLIAFLLSGCAQTVPPESDAPAEAEAPAAEEALPVQPVSAPAEPARPATVQKGAESLFRAKFEGPDVAGSGEIVDGVYRFAAGKTDGEAWHVKLESNYPTVAGRDYRVTYNFVSDVAGKVKFGDFQEFEIKKGENSVTGMVIASGGTSYLDLQLGMLPPFTIDFSSVEIEEFADEADYEDALSAPVNFERESVVWEKHDQGYAPVLSRSGDAVSIEYLATSWDSGVWKSRLYVRTGLIPEAGVRYRITAEVSCDQDLPFELLFNNGEEEKGYGALYGQSAAAGELTTCEAVVIGGGEGDELILQFSFGEAPEGSVVKVGALHVEKIIDHYSGKLPTGFALDKSVETGKTVTTPIPVSYKDVPLANFSYSGTDTVYETHDDDYEVSLEESVSSATLKITKAPASGRGVWKVRLYAATGVTLEAGKTYRIRYNLASTGRQDTYEALFAGDTNEAYGADKNRSLTAGGTDQVEYLVTPDASHGPLTLILQLGLTNSAAGNTVTLSGLSVEKVTAQYQEVAAVSYGGGATADFWAHRDYMGACGAALTQGDGSASFQITAPPASGREAWKVKLFANSVAQLTGGKTYRVSVDASSTEDFEYQICYNDQPNGGGEQALGFKGGLQASSAPSTVSFDVHPAADAALSLQFNLGLAADPATFTIGNVKVQELTVTGDTSTAMSGYPVTTHHDAVWAAQALSLSADCAAWDGSEATASVSGGGAALSITAKNDGREGSGVWSTILFVGTGVTPEAGETYRVSFNLSATEDPGEFEIKCSNGKNNDGGYCGRWGQHLSADRCSLEFTAPNSGCGELYLSFPLGNSPAPNTVTVSGVTVEKQTAAGYDETVGNNFHIVPENDPNEKATLSGVGQSAKATINASSCSDDWKIKLYANTHIELQQGKSYRIDMNVAGADWTVDYKRTGGDGESEFNGTMSFGSTTSNTVTPSVTGNLEIVLKIGRVAVGNSVTVSGITVTELGSETLSPTNIAALDGVGYWTHEDYGKADAGTLTASGGAAAFEIKAPAASDREPWKVKLFLNTGIALSSGKTYRISADVVSTAALDYEICYNDQPNGGGEKALGAEYGLRAGTAVQTVVHTVKADAGAPLNLQLNLGLVSAPCTVTVSNVKVEESLGESVESLLHFLVYNSSGSISRAADEGYVTSLEQSAASATFRILQAPAVRNPWNVKLNVRSGFTPEKDKGYRVSFDLYASRSQGSFELFLDGSSEGAYGQFYGPALTAGKNSVSQIIYPGDSKGELALQLRLGKTNGTDGNSYTISNLRIEEVAFRYEQAPETKEAVTLDKQNGYIEHLEKTPGRAAVRIEKTPAEGKEPWKSKLFVETGVALKAGQKYRVSMVVKSIVPAPFEVCFNDGGAEKGVGAIFGQISTPSGRYVEYVTYARQDAQLVIQLSLGNCSAPNSIMLERVKVEQAGRIDPISDTVYTFS